MNPLIELFIAELQRVLIDQVVGVMFSDLQKRDIEMILLGMIVTLLILELR